MQSLRVLSAGQIIGRERDLSCSTHQQNLSLAGIDSLTKKV